MKINLTSEGTDGDKNDNGSTNRLLKVFWFSRAAALRVFWFSRAAALRVFWFSRAAALRVFWFSRAAALRVFWFSRAQIFLFYWLLRSGKYRIKHIVKNQYYHRLHRFYIFRSLFLLLLKVSAYTKRKMIIIRSLGRSETFQIINTDEFRLDSFERILEYGELSSKSITSLNISFKDNNYQLNETPMWNHSTQLIAFHTSNAIVRGNANFITRDKCAFFPQQYQPKTEIIPIEMTGLGKVNLRNLSISIVKAPQKRVASGINLTGSASGNYAHWLLEILPKALLIEMADIQDSVPFLVDKWIHPNMIQSLALLVNSNRKIVMVERSAELLVEQLFDARIQTYIPAESRYYFEKKIQKDVDPRWFTFNQNSLNLVRNSVKTLLPKTELKRREKLFLIRDPKTSGNARHLKNIADLSQIATKFGYHIVDPGKISFHEQVNLFANATRVISPIGASIANLIYCEPGVNLICLAPLVINGNYNFFHQLMLNCNHKMIYLLGKTHGGGHHDQISYSIDPMSFEKLLEAKESDSFIN